MSNALQHVKFRDLAKPRAKGIDGCHDAVEFGKIRQVDASANPTYQVAIGKTVNEVEEIIITKTTIHSTTPGVKTVEYKRPALDTKLITTGALKGNGAKPFIKTLYDPAIWPDAKLEKALKEALQDAANKGKMEEGKFISGLTSEGYDMEFIIRKGKVSTFYFK